MSRIFLVSPASSTGRRARMLFSERASFELAVRLRSEAGAPLGQVFAFVSGLYFRGKLAYANSFAAPPSGVPGVLVITSCEGLRPPEEHVSLDRLRRYGEVPIDAASEPYREPLLRDLRALAAALEATPDCEVVLLGSVASGKYVDLMTGVLGSRLRFPAEFVGRGDMSRGGLMLRCVQDARELEYVEVGSVARRGRRPAKLVPRPGILGSVARRER